MSGTGPVLPEQVNFPQPDPAKKILCKVRLIRIAISIAITISFEIFWARSGNFFSGKVWSKALQSKSGEKNFIRVCSKNRDRL